MSTLEMAPGVGTPEKRDEVSKMAAELAESAGEAMIEATRGMEQPRIPDGARSASIEKVKDGRITTITSQKRLSGVHTRRVDIRSKPSLLSRALSRVRRDRVGDPEMSNKKESAITTSSNGDVHYSTVMPSALGGTVEHISTVRTYEDGTNGVSYRVVRRDEEGNPIVRRKKGYSELGYAGYAHQKTEEQLEMDARQDRKIANEKDSETRAFLEQQARKAREEIDKPQKVAMKTAKAIATRVRGDLTGESRRAVRQIPKGVEDFVDVNKYRRKKPTEGEDRELPPSSY